MAPRERFFRCPLCDLAHSFDIHECPVSGRPIDERLLEHPVSTIEHAATAIAEDPSSPDEPAPPAPFELRTGSLLDQKYLLGQPLGAGGMGIVYDAVHVLLARRVAVKLIRNQAASGGAAESRFLKEGRTLASVAHPHVVNVFDFGVCGGLQYLVMEYLEGESLAARLSREGRLDLPSAISIARQILSGLAAAHARGIVHRDLKPANVFLRSDPNGEPHVKLIDFGISTACNKVESDPRLAGTPSYLPPEQARSEPVDARADIYAFGATLYEMLTGQPPLVAPSLPKLLMAIQLDKPVPPGKLRAEVPKEIDQLVRKTLEKRREDRFASADEVLDALTGATAPRSRRGGYILVADSDPAAEEACQRAAAALGRHVYVARDGLEALDIVDERGLPALLVTNLSLPRMDGVALLAELRKTAPASVLPAIAASNFAAIRSMIWSAKEALGLSEIIPSLTDDAAVERAMAAALRGEVAPAPPPPARSASVERRRLDKIQKLRLVDDAPPDAALQQLVADVAQAFNVPVALVSLVLEDRQWFKSYFGVEGDLLAQRGTLRELAFCSHVVDANEQLVVPDAASHPAFRDNPLVKEGLVGGYAGAPLVTSSGEVLGTLCIVDKDRLKVSAEMLDALGSLARRVAGDLELRSGRPTPVPEQTVLDDGGAVLVLDEERRVVRANAAIERLFGVAPGRLIGMKRDDAVKLFAERFADPARYLRAVRVLPKGPFAGNAVLEMRGARDGAPSRRVRWHVKPRPTAGGVEHVEVYRDVSPREDD